jgi:hypothetical protein
MGEKCIEKLENFKQTAADNHLRVSSDFERITIVKELRDAVRENGSHLGAALGIKSKVRLFLPMRLTSLQCPTIAEDSVVDYLL